MVRFLPSLVPIALLSAVYAAGAPTHLVYVGTYTDLSLLEPLHRNPPGERSQGIYVFRFDPDNGTLTPLGLAAQAVNPTYLTFSPSGGFLYATNEIYHYDGQAVGTVSAFSIDPTSGHLDFLNRISSQGTGPCYARVDPSDRNLLVANFGSGSVAILPLSTDGALRPASAFVQDAGSGPNPRQAGPHAHSFNVSPDNRFAIEAEFGLDKLLVYHFDAAAGTLSPAQPPFVALKPGAAPRHFVFHPRGDTAYVLNEIDSTITVLAYARDQGSFRELQTVSTLPAGFSGKNTAAEVLVHPSGKFLYASNRGHNSIAVFAIDGADRLQLLANVPSGGRTPRGFSLDPDGHWIIAANQDTNNLAVFAIDVKTGIPAPTGQSLEVRIPVCVKFR
jgi:6-phosphogluconolactonase